MCTLRRRRAYWAMPTVLPMHAARKDHIRILAAMPPIESPKPRPRHPYQMIARMSPEARNFAPIEHPQESSRLESGKSLGSKFRDVRKRRTRRRPIGVLCNMGGVVQSVASISGDRRTTFSRSYARATVLASVANAIGWICIAGTRNVPSVCGNTF